MKLSARHFGSVVASVVEVYKDAHAEVDFDGRHLIVINNGQWCLGMGASREHAWIDAWRTVHKTRLQKKFREPIKIEVDVPRYRAAVNFEEAPKHVQMMIWGTVGTKTLIGSFLCRDWTDAKKTAVNYLSRMRVPAGTY